MLAVGSLEGAQPMTATPKSPAKATDEKTEDPTKGLRKEKTDIETPSNLYYKDNLR